MKKRLPTLPLLMRPAPLALACFLGMLSPASHAIDFGPNGMFSLTGFAELDVTSQGKYCLNCQVADNSVSKQIKAADAVIPGKRYESVVTSFWQVQPYLGFKYNLGQGYELSGMLSQRWRDSTVEGKHVETRYGGKVDVPGYWYERNIALRHEDFGSVRVGSMTTRSWSLADYPYGTNIGLAEAWGSSGAGYGMLGKAIRVGTRPLDFAEGELFLELTHDKGDTGFKRLKPSFYEFYAQYHKGDLVVDAVLQEGKNGGAGAWGHAPFSGVTPFSADDSFVASDTKVQFGPNAQRIAMVLARYQVNSKLEVSGGLRRNSWSGASLVYNPATNWTSGFNVDYSNPLATTNPAYGARSVDVSLGVRYFMDKWTFMTGLVYLGKANTNNPSDRGQTNSALINTLGAQYKYTNNLQLQATLGHVSYGKKGLSPMSMPGNSSFTNVDSRVSKSGGWLTLGAVYTF